MAWVLQRPLLGADDGNRFREKLRAGPLHRGGNSAVEQRLLIRTAPGHKSDPDIRQSRGKLL